MTKASPTRAAKKQASKGKLPSIGGEQLEALRDAKAELDEKTAITQEMQAKFNRMVVQRLTGLRQPVETSIICLDCGSVRKNTVESCPACVD